MSPAFRSPRERALHRMRAWRNSACTKRIGTTRSIIVQPEPYLTDNHVTLDTIIRLAGNSRGSPSSSDRHGGRIEGPQ
jgi:hypothetical protein